MKVKHRLQYQANQALSKQTLPRNRDAEMQQNYVFLLNADKTFLNMIPAPRARVLQDKHKAAVFRQYPYVLILKEQVENPQLKQYRLKIDPGSKHTGLSIQCGNEIVFMMELNHRGEAIKADLQARAGYRRGRRSRNVRYRKKRFNRNKPEEWLAPSLIHRVQTTETWIKRLLRYCPITDIDIEQVKFDTQALQNPEISGIEYQQGELYEGYEVREYILDKYQRTCVYCQAKNVPLQIDHIHPKSRGGSNRVSNLTLACENCNQAKGNKPVEEFLEDKPEVLKKIKSQAKAPLKDAAAVNSTRFAIVRMAKSHCSSVHCWTGGRTKFNRVSQNLIKTHAIDAACVGDSGVNLTFRTHQPLIADCKGHGSRQARRNNASGFPAITTKVDQKTGKKIVRLIKAKKDYSHISTGDVVKVNLIKNRKHIKRGVYKARVKTPIKKGVEVIINGYRIGIDIKFINILYQNDGYVYRFTPTLTNLSQDHYLA